MRGWLFALAWTAGCSFAPGQALTAGGGGDAPQPMRDALRGSADAAVPIDAKVFLDGSVNVTGSLTVTATPYGSTNHDVNLTTEGKTDWVHWGYTDNTSFDRKVGGNAISNLTATPSLRFTGAPLTATWIVGTPHANATMNSAGVGTKAGATMTFTVSADTTVKTLHVYAGVQQAAARLDVSLSDGSATAQSKTYSNNTSTDNVEYTITFNAASAGQTLTVSWTDTQDFGGSSAFDALMSATLE